MIEDTGRNRSRPPTIDVDLARRLVSEQLPQWSQLPITQLTPGGVDNRTFRLGPELTIRLPSGDWYAEQVDKEQRWLPVLAPQLPLPIPGPVARGVPGCGYPYPWSVYRWLPGDTATMDRIHDPVAFAVDLAGFLRALARVDATGGPAPGQHNFFRGGPLTTYDAETRAALDQLGGSIPGAAAARVWNEALDATWTGPPVWFHGDVAEANLLVRGGRLAAVIDFGCAGVGDPACDVVIAWTLLSGPSRAAFAEALQVDEATWARGRGWALWKALITLAGQPESPARRVLEAVLADSRV